MSDAGDIGEAAATPRPIVLNVGITGHRAGVLTAPLVRALRPIVFSIFRELRAATLNLQQSDDAFCSHASAQLLLHTALATGADQIAAICGRSNGYFVRALLPFEPLEYRKDFADGDELEGFEQALAAADEIVSLPGSRDRLEDAYVLVGRSLVEAADILIAIWDGEAGKGPGGTAHVVQIALENDVPVIHVDIDHGSDVVRVRAMTGVNPDSAFRESLRDPEFYDAALRIALKREAAGEQETAAALV